MMQKQTAPILVLIAIVMVSIAACGSPRNERPVAMLAPVTVAPGTADESGETGRFARANPGLCHSNADAATPAAAGAGL